MSSRIAARYAKSLLSFAQEKSAVEDVYRDMSDLLEANSGSVDLQQMLKSPIISSDKKIAVLGQVLKGAHEASNSFISLIMDKRREEHLPAIASQFIQLYDKEKGIARATVYSAIPLGDTVMDQLRKYLSTLLQSENIELINVIDSSVIGGMVVRYGDKLLDMSVSRELKEMRKHLVYN